MTTIHPLSAPLTGAEVELEAMRPRVTPRPASVRFRDTLEDGADVVLAGVESAAGFVPGGSSVSAAIRGALDTGGTDAAAPSAGSSTGALGESGQSPDMVSQVHDDTMQLLELQQRISLEQRQYMTTSNVMKARHDTAKQVINNVR